MTTDKTISFLIVDDEEEIREGISQTIPWAEHGICISGLAANGREAWEHIQTEKPDIVLLDIRMPVMNGLHLLEKTAQMDRPPRVVILSGYDDFAYCQQAIKQGASDYLLKPCQPAEILSVVVKLKDEILTAKLQTAEWDKLRTQFHENLELSREKLILYLIRTEQPPGEVGREKWRLYEMPLPDEHIGTALVRIHRSSYSGETLELHKLAVQNLASELLERSPRIAHFLCDHNDELLILWNNPTASRLLFCERMEELRQTVQSQYPFVVTIGIGETAATLGELCYAFQTALQAVEHSFWSGANRIIDYQAIEQTDLIDHAEHAPSEGSSGAPAYPAAEEAAILQCLRTSDAERIHPAVEDFFAFITRNRAVPDVSTKQYARRVITALICSAYHVCIERGLDCEGIFGSDFKILDELNKQETFAGIKSRLWDCINQILNQTSTHKNSWKTVNNALKYMDGHFCEELSLDAVAQQVYVSPGYLSTLFKQELRKNFVDSLHEIRVAKAKELLRGSRVKIYEVAVRVGYHDEKYFSQIFKRIAGMTPNQYRESTQRD